MLAVVIVMHFYVSVTPLGPLEASPQQRQTPHCLEADGETTQATLNEQS